MLLKISKTFLRISNTEDTGRSAPVGVKLHLKHGAILHLKMVGLVPVRALERIAEVVSTFTTIGIK